MASDDLSSRLERDPAKVECSICRHRQWFGATTGRCEQCGSEITLYANRGPAREALVGLVDAGRVAYVTETDRGLFAVIANRSFQRP
ncbi:hypothetical protein BH18GEM1_BH18GEM1_12210 [soil metagenome]